MKKRATEETRLTAPKKSSVPVEAERPAVRARRPTEELVPKVVEAIDVLTEYLGLDIPNPETARRMRGARTVSRDFVLSMIASVESEHQLTVVGRFDPLRAREVLEARDALRIVGERLKIFQSRLSYTIEAEWAEIVAAALYTYHQAEIVSDLPSYAALTPHLEILRHHLGRKNGSSKAKGKKRKKEGEGKGEE